MAPPQTAPFRREPIDRNLRRDVWSMTDGRCFYCGMRTNPFATFCIDHIFPVSRGGSNDIRNLVPCCAYCNQAKGTKLLDDWRPAKPFWFESDEFIQDCESVRAHVIWEWLADQITDEEAPDEDAAEEEGGG